MKLIDNFKKQIETLGELKRVWLTTFNLDISFVERIVLPAILKVDPPVSRLDYEGLQQAFIDSGIEVRIFCDARMIARDKPKKTSITISPVSARNLMLDKSPYKEYFDHNESLFHPKVFYLENKSGQIILGAGSANLTLSGWGRNQEVVDFRKVNSSQQYKQIKSFFTLIDSELERKLNEKKKLYDCNEEWSFIHSLNGDTLWQTLAGDEVIKKLSVWSPYFSKDLAQLINDFDEPDLNVELVPDLVQGYIRSAWNKDVQSMIENSQLSFYLSPNPVDDRTLMTHAKLWLAQTKTQKRLAIGSWNFTHRGICSLEDTYWNIEAGIVHPVSSQVSVCDYEQPLVITESNFASPELLENEKLITPMLLPFELMVTFDWITSEYTLEGQWVEGAPQDDYYLYLPGINQAITLEWNNRGNKLKKIVSPLFVLNTDALLNNQFYRVEFNDQPDWIGMINEVNFEYRRIYRVSTLDELLNNYINMVDITNGAANLQLRDSESKEESESSESFELATVTNPISYFRLFHAMKLRLTRMEQIENHEQFYRSLFVAPDSLRELVDKTNEEIKKDPTSLFNWFLANEVNALTCFAKKRLKQLPQEKIPQKKSTPAFTVSMSLWRSLQVHVPTLSCNQVTRKYIEKVQRECRYG